MLQTLRISREEKGNIEGVAEVLGNEQKTEVRTSERAGTGPGCYWGRRSISCWNEEHWAGLETRVKEHEARRASCGELGMRQQRISRCTGQNGRLNVLQAAGAHWCDRL